MACHHEPIQNLVLTPEHGINFRTPSQVIFTRSEPDLGVLSSWELIFESDPYKINRMWSRSGRDVTLVRKLVELRISLGSVI
jgi:hypothetical protein